MITGCWGGVKGVGCHGKLVRRSVQMSAEAVGGAPTHSFTLPPSPAPSSSRAHLCTSGMPVFYPLSVCPEIPGIFPHIGPRGNLWESSGGYCRNSTEEHCSGGFLGSCRQPRAPDRAHSRSLPGTCAHSRPVSTAGVAIARMGRTTGIIGIDPDEAGNETVVCITQRDTEWCRTLPVLEGLTVLSAGYILPRRSFVVLP